MDGRVPGILSDRRRQDLLSEFGVDDCEVHRLAGRSVHERGVCPVTPNELPGFGSGQCLREDPHDVADGLRCQSPAWQRVP